MSSRKKKNTADFELGYTEFTALAYLLNNLDKLQAQVSNVTIRLHPAEALDKYDFFLSKFDLPVSISENESLIVDISSAKTVVGMDSMALVIGMIASKEVIFCIPPQGKPSRLPHTDIMYLRDVN